MVIIRKTTIKSRLLECNIRGNVQHASHRATNKDTKKHKLRRLDHLSAIPKFTNVSVASNMRIYRRVVEYEPRESISRMNRRLCGRDAYRRVIGQKSCVLHLKATSSHCHDGLIHGCLQASHPTSAHALLSLLYLVAISS